MWSRIQEIRLGPPQLPHRSIGCEPRLTRLRTNYQVLSIGLVPNRHHLNTSMGGKDARLKLRFGLVGKPVTNT